MVKKKSEPVELRAGNRVIAVSNPDKILFPKSKITKLEMVEYYNKISGYILPFLKDRPLSLVRCPNGIEEECFFQKNAPDFYPDWVKRIPVQKSDKSIINYVNCDSKATLVYIANQGCLTPHPWLSKLPELNNPDKIVFDLDPHTTFDVVQETALILKEYLDKKKLKSFVMTTGSKGMHVVIPIKPKYNFDHVRDFARDIAEELAGQHPDFITTEIRIEKRKGKVFIDYLRNSWGATSVAPYSIRPKEDAPVATSISWEEAKDKNLVSTRYNINNIFKYLAKNDPWKNFERSKVDLKL